MTGPRWSRDPAVLWRVTPFAVVALARGGDTPVVLAGTGMDLWELLDSPRDLSELAGELARRYGATTHRVEEDVATTLADLERRGIVVPVP